MGGRRRRARASSADWPSRRPSPSPDSPRRRVGPMTRRRPGPPRRGRRGDPPRGGREPGGPWLSGRGGRDGADALRSWDGGARTWCCSTSACPIATACPSCDASAARPRPRSSSSRRVARRTTRWRRSSRRRRLRHEAVRAGRASGARRGPAASGRRSGGGPGRPADASVPFVSTSAAARQVDGATDRPDAARIRAAQGAARPARPARHPGPAPAGRVGHGLLRRGPLPARLRQPTATQARRGRPVRRAGLIVAEPGIGYRIGEGEAAPDAGMLSDR